MNEYIPATEVVRQAVGDALCPDPDDPAHKTVGCEGDAAFDRWLAQHDREVAAKALRMVQEHISATLDRIERSES